MDEREMVSAEEAREMATACGYASLQPWAMEDDGDDYVIAAPESAVEIARVHHAEDAEIDAQHIVNAVNFAPRACATIVTLHEELARLRAEHAAVKDQCKTAESVADYRLVTMRLALRRHDAEEVEDVRFLDVLRAEHAAALDAARREGAEDERRRCVRIAKSYAGPFALMVSEVSQCALDIARDIDAPGGGS